MNRAFGFTNGLRRSPRGADQQQDEGGNKNHSVESWQFTDGGQGSQRGPNGPPRDMNLGNSTMADTRDLQAIEGTSGRLAFPSRRGPPPGMEFGKIPQEMPPTQESIGQGANRPPAAATGNIAMWAREPGNELQQLTPAPQPRGGHTGTIGAGLPWAIPELAAVANVPQVGHEKRPQPHAIRQGGASGYSGVGTVLEKL